MQKKVIIITGASGLIGTALLSAFKNYKKYKVIGIYNTNKPLIESNNIIHFKGDLTRKSVWSDLMEFNVDSIIHCAAKIPKSFDSPESEEVRLLNLKMDKLAILYARKKNARFIYISSSSAYGLIMGKVYNERCRLNPIGQYAKGKVETEKMILKRKGNLRYFILRISAPYGPHQRYTTILKIFIKNALRGKPLKYYGTGSRTQDFTYVKDIANVCLKAVESDKYGVYNIASGQSISMKDLAFLIKNLIQSKSIVQAAQVPDPQETYRGKIDISKAKKILGWYPMYTLERGLSEFIEYIKNGGG